MDQHKPSSEHELALLRTDYAVLREFFENTPDMLLSVDADSGTIRDCNRALLQAIRRRREDVIGVPIQELYHLDCAQQCTELFDQLIEAKEVRSDTLRLLLPAGQSLAVSMQMIAVRDASGRLRHSHSILRDLKRSNEVSDLRLEARIQEAQRLEGLAVLAGGIAHDFNNLLVGVLGNVGVAQLSLPAEAPVRPILADIETTALRAADLTRQLLAYSGKGRFEVTTLDLGRLVEEMAHLLMTAISPKVVLRFDPSDDPAIIDADATQIRQVVMNLITNGSDATGSRSGLVTVRTGIVDADEEYLQGMVVGSKENPGYYAFLEVSDTGCGMDPEIVDRMFDPFFTTKVSGHGLGLAATLGIVRGHRGAIRVYSEPGKGTAIKVLFPLSGCEVRNTREDQEGARRGSGLILVVDDEETVRAVVRRSLEFEGYEVITSQDGREGVQAYNSRADEIRLVLLDMTMPHLNGKEAFRQMRKRNEDVRVLLMSGHNEQEATTAFTGRGLVGFIQKPFRARDLLDKVFAVLT